jgi:hypothetical protein
VHCKRNPIFYLISLTGIPIELSLYMSSSPEATALHRLVEGAEGDLVFRIDSVH